MNKYLSKRNELEKILEEEFKEPSYEVFSKMIIAGELSYMLEWDEFENFELTDKQEEELINIIYDLYIDWEDDIGFFKPTKAVLFTMRKYGTYLNFIDEYKTNYSKVIDNFAWEL